MSRLAGWHFCAALLLLTGVPAPGQSWEALRDLKPGDRVQVWDSAGQRYAGAFASFSAEKLSFKTNTGERGIERLRVRQVRVHSNTRRFRNVLIGAGIGLAAGILADSTLGAYLRNEGGQSAGARALTYVIPIGLFGGIGAALPPWRTAYRAR